MLSNYCQKGDMIGIKGVVLTGSYEKDGKKVYTQDIVIQDINFLGVGKSDTVKENKVEEKVEEDPFEAFSKEVELSEFDNKLPF